jgi:uncharacterized radical SAM superfamily protein
MQPSADTVWEKSTKELVDFLNADALKPKLDVVRFYVPGFMYYKTKYYNSSPAFFPTVSITGTACALNCKHCGGKILKAMRSATSPNQLFKLASNLKRQGALGCLISGGCTPHGSVPLKQFIPTIEKIKCELDLTVFVHTGIINLATAVALKRAGVDATLIDVIGSDETIKKIGNLILTVKDYAASLNAMQKARLNIVPHVIVGLHDGKLKGELYALKTIASVKPSALVVISFLPIHGTAMATIKPPQPADIGKVIATARLMFPQTPLVLGCVRPKGRHRAETDVLALKAGVDGIAFPSEEAIGYAVQQGYEVNFSSHCCAQIYLNAPFRSVSK